MTATVFVGTLLAGIKAALEAAPALAGVPIGINATRPVFAAKNATIVLRLDQARANENVLGLLDWTTGVDVECYARGVTNQDPAQAVDGLLASVWASLAAIDTATLGGADVRLSPSIDWVFDTTTEHPVVCATVHLVLQHRTNTTSLTA